MDGRLVDLLRTTDPGVLGTRIRTARSAAGMTQKELGGSDVTVSYVSRIESGARRPEPRVLSRLAERLGTSVEELLVGVSAKEADAVRIDIDFAELSLELGDMKEAAARLDEILGDETVRSMKEYGRARLLRARAYEAMGDLDGAILALESLMKEDPGYQTVAAGIALSRCYRESGDLSRAIQTGESVLARLSESGLTVGDEIIQLTVTVAAAYFEQGDTGYAVRLCRQAMEAADRSGSPTARASAYWNASVMEKERGNIAAAVPLAKRAIGLLGEGHDGLSLARLRSQLGRMQLHLDPPDTAEAERNLEMAAVELASSSASPVDLARNTLARAKSRLLCGDLHGAEARVGEVLAASNDQTPLNAAEAHSIRGQVAATQGDLDAAKSCFLAAVHALSSIGADRGAGQLWVDLGALLESVGELDTARDAYRRAAVSAGLHVQLPAAQSVCV